MKALWNCLPIGLALALSHCEPIGPQPPKDQPVADWGVLRAGQFARTVTDNTSFFHDIPLTGDQADMLLQRHTSLRVIRADLGYSKVELDSGQVGYVLTAMLEPIPREKPPTPPFQPDSPQGGGRDDPPPVGSGMPELLPPTIEPE